MPTSPPDVDDQPLDGPNRPDLKDCVFKSKFPAQPANRCVGWPLLLDGAGHQRPDQKGGCHESRAQPATNAGAQRSSPPVVSALSDRLHHSLWVLSLWVLSLWVLSHWVLHSEAWAHPEGRAKIRCSTQ